MPKSIVSPRDWPVSRSAMALGLFLMALAPGVARGDFLLGVNDRSGQIIKIDPATGVGTVAGDFLPRSREEGPEDIVTDGDGNLIIVSYETGVNSVASFKTTFSRIDPVTFQKTVLGTAFAYEFFEGLANVNGVLYGSASTSGSYGLDTSDHLVRIDLKAGTFTEVGLFGADFQNVEDIAYSPTYGLIGVDIGTLDPATGYHTFHTTPALIRIDPLTGHATKIADLPPLPPGTVNLVGDPFNSLTSPYGPFLAGLDFAPDGTLYATTFPTHYGGESRLVKVDPLTGAITDVGDTGFTNIDGITYVATVPEPSGIAMMGVGAALVAMRALRRRVVAGNRGCREVATPCFD